MAVLCAFKNIVHSKPAISVPNLQGFNRFRNSLQPESIRHLNKRANRLETSLLYFDRHSRTRIISAALAEKDDPSSDNKDDQENSAYGTCDPLCSVDEVSSAEFDDNKKSKTDLFKAITIFASVAAGAAAINHSWVAENQGLAMILVFTLGYAGIIFEESLAFNKSGVGLLMAVTLWVIRSIGAPSPEAAVEELTTKSAEVSEIVFFLLGAMTIVEIIDAHQGFKLVTDNITTRKPKILLWVAARMMTGSQAARMMTRSQAARMMSCKYFAKPSIYT